MVDQVAHDDASNADGVCTDKDISDKRGKTYSKLMWGPTLSSVAQLCGMFGGPMLAAGLLALIGIGAATPVLSTAAVVATAVGASLSVAGVVINYIGARTQNDGWLDQTEMGALTNARYLVKELKANNMCLTTEHEDNCRTDGKQWAQVIQLAEQAKHVRG